MLKLSLFALLGFVLFMLIQHLFIFQYLAIEMNLTKIYDHSYQVLNTKKLAKNFIKEFKYAMAKIYLYPVQFLNLNKKAIDPKQVIVLVHGYGRSQVDWLWFKRKLHANSVYLVNLKPMFGSIEEISQNLDFNIQKIMQENPHAEINLIGHSMGGVVSCYYAANLDLNHRIRNIITLGSPLHGTKLAVAVSTKNMIQLRPGSSFLEELRKTISKRKKLEIFNIATKTDNLIYPWNSPLLESTKNSKTLILEDESHLGLIHNLAAIQQIKQWLSI